jgi:nucleotide-binding universal stress UspA family protein
VDGSDQSYDAVRALERMNSADPAILLHVVDVPLPAYPMMMPEVSRELYATVAKQMKEDGQRLLDRIAQLLPSGARAVLKRLEVGKPAEVIVNTARAEQAGLVVLGGRGLSPLKEMFLGSVSHRVVTLAPCPVMVTRFPLRQLQTVVLAVEDAEDAKKALTFLAAKPFNNWPQVTVLNVLPFGQALWPVGLSESDALKEKALAAARDFVDGVAGKLSGLGYAATGSVTLGDAGPAIVGWAKTTKPDLIVIGKRDRKGAAEVLLGSASHTVLHHAPCPVLVMR